MTLRDHDPIILDTFNGLYIRGSSDSTPLDHFPEGENFQFEGTSSFETRDGIDVSQSIGVPLTSILRIYNYITQDANTMLALTVGGKIYHIINNGITALGPILTIATMTDFAFVPVAGRAYITPFATYGTAPNQQEKGIQNEFLYVYLGDGTPARKTAGTAPAGTLTVANGAAGHTDAGFHLFAVVGETDTGYQSPPIAFASLTTGAALSVSFSTIPTFTGAQWTKRHIVATKIITGYNGDTTGYTYYFLPTGTISDNTSTTLSNISFYDADLLDDASHLLDNYSSIPAGAAITLYHGRLCLACTYTDISLILVSAEGEPEAISQIDGLIVVPLDGNPITQMQELRDILYVFKRNRTVSYIDNQDAPSSWPEIMIDMGIGCSVHGVATVIDSGSSNVDFLIAASYKGITIFNGRYLIPELSWKIADYWLGQERNDFREIQILNDSVHQILYISLPNELLLIGDYRNGLDPKKIRWALWRFDFQTTTICLVNDSTLVIGSLRRLVA